VEVAVFSPRPRAFVAIALILSLPVLLLLVGCNDYYVPCDGDECIDWRYSPPRSQTALVNELATSYQTRDYDRFSDLFSTAADSAPYFFTFGDSAGGRWDLLQELCCHRRMFRPEAPLPGETPVPPELWLASIDIHLEGQTAWAERPDLYRSESNPGGLDGLRWKATGARYLCYVLFTTQGPTNYQINAPADFVVIEDLAKNVGSDRKFLLYRWDDLGGGSTARRLYACPPPRATGAATAVMPSN
jgi:hypothetical protein